MSLEGNSMKSKSLLTTSPSTNRRTALIIITFVMPMFYGLFLLFGFLYEVVFHSKSTHYKIDSFYKSELTTSKISNVLLGDWDRICYLQSHKTIDLEAILNRKLSFSERILWNFRVDFVDFDHDGGVRFMKKITTLKKLNSQEYFSVVKVRVVILIPILI